MGTLLLTLVPILLQEQEQLRYNDEIGLETASDDDSPRSPSPGSQTLPDIRPDIRSNSARDLSHARSRERGSSGLLHVRAPPSELSFIHHPIHPQLRLGREQRLQSQTYLRCWIGERS